MSIAAIIKSAQELKKRAENAEKETRLADRKSVQSQKKADEYYIRLGQKLAELKKMKPSDITWPDFAKKHFGYSQTRADELIRIGKGAVSLEATRKEKARSAGESMKKSRAKSSTNKDVSAGSEDDNVIRPSFKKASKPTPEEGDCDYDDGDPEHVKGDTKEQIRRQIFLNMAREWGIKRPTEVLDASFFSRAAPEEVTDDLFVEIDAVIGAWNEIAAKLRRLRKATGKGKAVSK
jgi:hypothetical protein